MFGMSREELTELFSELRTRGFTFGIDIGVDPGDTIHRAELLRELPFIGLASGIYPGAAETPLKLSEQLDTLIYDIQASHPVALGEIGLDWFHGYGSESDQIGLFQEQITIANAHSLPIIIHNRDADEAVLNVIRDHPPKEGGIVHCFSSDKTAARRFLEAGLLISFAGPVTYRKNTALRDVIPYVPLDRIVLETDSPYLIPEPFRGKGLKNSPGYMHVIYDRVAQLYEIPTERLCERIEENVRNVLRLTESGRQVLTFAD